MAPAVGIPVVDFLLHLIADHGYLITFVATVMENLFIVGMVTPGEVFVMAGGFVAATGAIDPWLVGAASIIGTLVGSNATYFFGRHGGRPALDRYGHRFRIDERRIEAAEEYFRVHGSKTLVLARFAAGVKNFAPMIAGVSRMPVMVFEAYTLLGAIIYTTLMVLLGYFFGHELPLLVKIVTRSSYVGLALLALLVVTALYGKHKVTRRRIDRYSAMYEEDQTEEE